MLKSKTVFVLGAGASFEVGFPLGYKLREIIAQKLNFKIDTFGGLSVGYGDRNIAMKLQSKYGHGYSEYLGVCKQISDGILLSDSIDDFIYKHRHDERVAICGKLAIAHSIVEAESKSELRIEPGDIYSTINFKSLPNNWYSKFYSLLTKSMPKSELDHIFDNITVVNFNYDRSIEHFLIHAFMSDYMIDKKEAENIVNKLVIYRPYGSIDKSTEFGANMLPDLNNIVSNLKTYTENIDEGEKLLEVKTAVEKAKTIVFLGMAYHINNMNLLKCKCDMREKIIYATRIKISDHDLAIVRRRIIDLGLNTRKLSDMVSMPILNNIFYSQECRNLFDDYRLSLSEL